MQNKARTKRIRSQIHFTLAPETLEWLKNNTSNASRLIDTLVNNVRTEISRDCLVLSKREAVNDGLAEIRTQDLRRVKATS
jgi:hypothetical protein